MHHATQGGRHGRRLEIATWQCGKCEGLFYVKGRPRYCPHCGARFDGHTDERGRRLDPEAPAQPEE